jgi:hypothetical protein
MVHKNSIQVVMIGASMATFLAGVSSAQIKYAVGANVDVTGGASGPDQQIRIFESSSKKYEGFYGTYPTLDLTAEGEHSSLVSSYAFGLSRTVAGPSRTTNSHAGSFKFSNSPQPKWKIDASDSFAKTSDITTFNLLRGDLSVPEQFRFAFNPVIANPSISNTATLDVSHLFNRKSSLSFGGSHSLLSYSAGSQFNGTLSDQQRFSANVSYTHNEEHSGWSVGYAGTQLQFNNFQNSRTHAATFGYSHKFSPVLSLRLSAGPSYLETQESVKHQFGSNGSLSLQRKYRDGSFSMNYSRASGDTSGLGSLSDTQQAGLSMNRQIGRKTTFYADATGVDTRGETVDAPSLRSVAASVSVGVEIAKMWSLNWGGQYQKNIGNTLFQFEQERVFVSLRFSNPGLWRF